jgi:hypothetical protein
MRSRSLFGFLLLPTVLFLPRESIGHTQANAKILLHLQATAAGNACTIEGGHPPCASIVTAGDLNPAAYFAYVLLADGNVDPGFAGVQFGISYNSITGSGVDVFDSRLCGSIQFASPEWPASGSGNIVAWNQCQTGAAPPDTNAVAVAGYFYVGAYTADEFRITTRPVDGLAKVADCNRAETTLPSPGAFGVVRFSAGATEPGYSPCGTNSEPDTCVILGPDSVVSGSTTAFSAESSAPGATFSWSVTGSGSISGPSTGSTIQVLAGAPGTFLLRVQFTGSDGSSDICLKPVSVTSASSCTILGPRTVVESSTVTYEVADPSPGDAFQWSVTGRGLIIASTTEPVVEVLVLEAGTFLLSLVVTSGGSGSQCELEASVLVEAPPPSGSNEQAKILVRLAQVSESTCVDVPCPAIETAGDLSTAYHAYVVVTDGYTNDQSQSGIAGVQFGIEYDDAAGSGVDIMGFTVCADYEFPTAGWPASGSGNRILWRTFDRCQFIAPGGRGTGVVATAGYFYLSATTNDTFRIRTAPGDGTARVIDCADVETIIVGPGVSPIPSPLGFASFSAEAGTPGYNPCGQVPVKSTTWGGIKALFREN